MNWGGATARPLAWLLERFEAHAKDEAVIWRDRAATYRQLLDRIGEARELLKSNGVRRGEVVLLDADFSPASIAMLVALIAEATIVVPLAAHVTADRDELGEIAQVSRSIEINDRDQYEVRTIDRPTAHPLLLRLQKEGSPGLVLFSSGSSGRPKATLHNLDFLLNKFKVERHTQRMITFLLFDHIGGFNTLMYTLSNHGCVITLEARDPETVCRTIAEYRAEVLPTSPTFLRLMLMSGAHRRHDLSSLKVINYA
ncbi:MAG: AMP-binding protein, partial [Phycisphaerales bacterium]|nr:AMP-binding protein [Phycisphaerales bacterium]